MNLPNLNELKSDQSTYIAFSKALVDFDKAIATGNPCYFTKMVTLNLPAWNETEFFLDLSTAMTDSGIALDASPNLVFPKAIQFYMENIIRQTTNVEEIVELAFWKLLNIMLLTDYKSTVTFINTIASSNFTSTENNNGWNEIICQIPNKCKSLTTVWKQTNIVDIITDVKTDICMFDNNGDFQFNFTGLKDVIDFDNCIYNDIEVKDFSFNVMLLFYTDQTGVNKLHGINFIYPFELISPTEKKLQTFTQKTNTNNTIGYQFKFNQKSCNNEATQIAIYAQDDHTHYNTFFDTLSKLNSFLEVKMRETPTQIS